jgi:hypothetical protein
VVEIRYIRNAGWPYNKDLVIVEQRIGEITHQFEADCGNIYPKRDDLIEILLFNEHQINKIVEHPKSFTMKNAREFVVGYLETLEKDQFQKIVSDFSKMYPNSMRKNKNGVIHYRKLKYAQWNELMHAYFHAKFPYKSIPVDMKKYVKSDDIPE